MPHLIVIAASIIVFSVLVISMGTKKKRAVRITGTLVAVVLLLGALIYGSCFGAICKDWPEAVAKTVNAMIEMFLGKDSLGDIKDAPLMQHLWFRLAAYAAHILAMYVTISSVLIAVAMRMLSRIRISLVRRGDLVIIYGVSEDTLGFAEKLIKDENVSVVFVGDNGSYSYESAILRIGAILMAGDEAAAPDKKLVKKTGLRPGQRKLQVFCLDEDTGANMRFAAALLEALKESGIDPSQTALSAVLRDEEMGSSLQAAEDRYGYGSVLAAGPMDLSAKLLINYAAPYTQMRFGKGGAAEEDFSALVLGFGRTGKAVLRSILMNSQFDGSKPSYCVVSREGDTTAGNFFARYPALKNMYDIQMLSCNARSAQFYDWLAKEGHKIKYVAVCTGDRKENAEVADEIEAYFRGRGLEPAIIECHRSGIIIRSGKGLVPGKKSIYDPAVLSGGGQDAMAKVINHWYDKDRDIEEAWRNCSYFNRMSCRAAADYADVFIAQAKAGSPEFAGIDRQSAVKADLSKDPELLETLARTEHLRWMAFHAAMGYQPMPPEVYDAREQQFLKEKAGSGEGRIRAGKDTKARLHACMIPWEDLDALSERESRATGKPKDYKQADRDNILALPGQLAALEAVKSQ